MKKNQILAIVGVVVLLLVSGVVVTLVSFNGDTEQMRTAILDSELVGTRDLGDDVGDSAVAVDGSCGSKLNNCVTGTLNDAPDTLSKYLWDCDGLDGGRTSYCSMNKDVVVEPINATSVNTNNAVVNVNDRNGVGNMENFNNANGDNERCEASIGDYIWYDSNGDGIQGNIEEGMPGVEVCAFNGNKKYCDKTNNNGKYKIKNLCKGVYYLVVKTVGNEVKTYDPDGKKDNKTKVELEFDNEKYIKADFGYRKLSAPEAGPATNVVLSLVVVLLLTGGVVFSMKKKDQI